MSLDMAGVVGSNPTRHNYNDAYLWPMLIIGWLSLFRLLEYSLNLNGITACLYENEILHK